MKHLKIMKNYDLESNFRVERKTKMVDINLKIIIHVAIQGGSALRRFFGPVVTYSSSQFNGNSYELVMAVCILRRIKDN